MYSLEKNTRNPSPKGPEQNSAPLASVLPTTYRTEFDFPPPVDVDYSARIFRHAKVCGAGLIDTANAHTPTTPPPESKAAFILNPRCPLFEPFPYTYLNSAPQNPFQFGQLQQPFPTLRAKSPLGTLDKPEFGTS